MLVIMQLVKDGNNHRCLSELNGRVLWKKGEGLSSTIYNPHVGASGLVGV